MLRRESNLDKQIYIIEKRKKCQKVVDVFAELYEMEKIVVIDAGRYGFVELKYYKLPHGFGEDATFTDSRTLFEELWREWRNTKLYLLAKDTPLSEKGYKGIFPYGRRTGRDKPIKRFRGKPERYITV